MTKFTKEKLQQIVETNHVQCGDAAVMARLLLSGMDQEPVAWTNQRSLDVRDKITAFTSKDSAEEYGEKSKWEEIVPLYAAPQLPQPAVVSAADRKDFEYWARDAGFNEDWYYFTNVHPNHYDDDHINDMWAAWSACRAAMLQGADGTLTDEDTKRVGELVMWIKRLAHSLRKAKPDSKLQSDAMDYLSRKGLIGVKDILR